jgi:Motility quorum-sensing regulator, toxin of MqsA
MSRWLPNVLKRVHDLVSAGRVLFTVKALRELASLDLGLDEEDAFEVLRRLRGSDSTGRLRSERTGEWLYVFLPRVAAQTLYVKLLLRADCVIVSFHEQANDDEEAGT